MKRLYFDFAAATPLSKTVLSAMQPYFTDEFYNPSALYIPAQEVRAAINEARSRVAGILGAKSSEIIFTAGGTEADNLAIQGVMNQFPEAHLVISAVEHDAVKEPASRYKQKIAPVKPDGRIELDKLFGLIDDSTVLVSVMYVNNEIGTVQPIADIAARVREIRSQRQKSGNDLPLYLHTDACQAANYLHLLVNTLGVDLMTLNGGKIYGPKQSGILFVKTGVNIKPHVLGGGQERNLRSGTENVPNIIGFTEALSEAAEIRETEAVRLRSLQRLFIEKLQEQLPEAAINGSLDYRVPNNVHITFPGADNERLMMELDERGIMVATGSACSASSDEPSHVLRAIGLTDDQARNSLRITFGRQTDQEAVDKLLEQLQALA